MLLRTIHRTALPRRLQPLPGLRWLQTVSRHSAAPVFTSSPDESLRAAFDTPSTSSHDTAVTGLFGQRSIVSPDDFTPLAHRTILRGQFIVQRICGQRSAPQSTAEAEGAFLDMVKMLDRLSDTLCGVIDLCEVVRNSHVDEEWREGANEAYGVLCEYMNELNTHVGLYESLKSIQSLLDPSTPSKSPALFAAYAVAVPFLKDFEKSGIHLPDAQRSKFVDLSSAIIRLGRDFLQNSAEPRDAVEISTSEVQHLFSEPFVQRTFGKSQTRAFDPQGWEARTLARQHPDEDVRRKLYLAANSAPKSHVETLEELLRTRGELARLVGRETWADVALEDKMAKTPANVMSFLSALNTHNLPRAKRDLARLQSAKQSHYGGDGKIKAWDRDYFCDLAGQTASPLPDISPFFSAGTCFQGLSRLFTSLYGIRFEVEDVKAGEVWDPSVKRLKVIDEDEGEIGTIYCDLFDRPGKGPGAAHYTVRCARRVDDDDAESDFLNGRAVIDGVEVDRRDLQGLEVNSVEYRGRPGRHQSPIIVLVCAFGQAEGGANFPAFLQWHEVETLFHEMGHAIHSMIGRTDYHNVAGTRCATDFVELPSILMEHFVSSPAVVSLFSRHPTTGRPLPTSVLTSLLNERRQFSALENSTQISMAAVDQAYHSSLPLSSSFDSTDVLRDTQSNFNVIPHAEGTAWQAQFGHLFGYGATYYSYLFDRAIAAHIFTTKFVSDPLSRDKGEEFKRLVLRWGGGKEPWEMVGGLVQSDVVSRGGQGAMAEVGRWGIEEANSSGI